MEFEKIQLDSKNHYWSWGDIDFFPYAWLKETELGSLPTPFYLEDIHPDCPVGFQNHHPDAKTNIISLPKKFDQLKLDSGLRKDLKRVDKKNESTQLKFNEKNALQKSQKWFLELWNEPKKDFQRRIEIWKKCAYTISAYREKKLLGVHIAMQDQNAVYYLGCWWDRSHSPLSIPTFLLKKDIERAIADGMQFYDLEVGSEPYKKKWGVIEKPTKYYAVLTPALAKELGVKQFVKM